MPKPTIPTTRILYSTQVAAEQALTAVFLDASQRIAGLLNRAANYEGVIPLAQLETVRSGAGRIIIDLFTAPLTSSVYPDKRAPFGADGITPLAPIPRLINQALARVVSGVVKGHYTFLKKVLPDDVLRGLQAAPIAEQQQPLRSNPLAQYDAPHTWVDPNGYTLSDRIWRAGYATRDKIDRILTDGIRQGKSALALSKELEQFLVPGRALLRTKKPYGTDASYDALRLTRTEIARAHAQASKAAAFANPFVSGVEWALSARHPKFDVCDGLATIGMQGQRMRPPYSLDGYVPLPVQDSHPNCICNTRPAVTDNVRGIIDELRGVLRTFQPIPPTPAQPMRFLELLLGVEFVRSLWGYIREWVGV